MPASLLMARIGRRKGFMAGAVISVRRLCARRAGDRSFGSFVLYCAATAVIGHLQRHRSSVSLRGSGGRGAGRQGESDLAGARRWRRRRLPRSGIRASRGGSLRDAVSGLASSRSRGFALLALVVQSFVHVPPPTLEERSGTGGRFRVIVRQPVFIVAVLAGAVGYGLMNLLMTATPDCDGLLQSSVRRRWRSSSSGTSSACSRPASSPDR